MTTQLIVAATAALLMTVGACSPLKQSGSEGPGYVGQSSEKGMVIPNARPTPITGSSPNATAGSKL